MSKFNNLLTGVFVGCLLALNANAEENTINKPTTPAEAQAQAMANYQILAAPPDIEQPANTWLIYFGPTEEEASKDPIAQAKREYVEKYSPLQTIPSRRVARPVTWFTLAPNEQINSNRSSGGGSNNNNSQINSYGY